MSTEEYDDEWTPITKEECTTLFEHEVALLCPDALKLLEKHGTTLTSYVVERFPDVYESIYVVARFEHTVLYFDDVEDEWGTGAVDDDGIIRRRGFYDSFWIALNVLERDANTYYAKR